MPDAACEVSVLPLLHQQPVDISDDTVAVSEDVSIHGIDDTSDARTLDVNPSQSVTVPSQQPSDVDADFSTCIDNIIRDVNTDCQHIHDDEYDSVLDETVYHDCIGTSFVG